MTVSKSCPPGPTRRTDRSPGRRRALLPLQSLGGRLHYRGSNGGEGGACAQGSKQALQAAAAAGGLCRIQEEPESSSRLQRLVNLAPSKAQGGVRACARVCARVCVCPDTHVPPYTCMPLLTVRGSDGSHGCQGCGACRSTPARRPRSATSELNGY